MITPKNDFFGKVKYGYGIMMDQRIESDYGHGGDFNGVSTQWSLCPGLRAKCLAR